MSEQNCKELEIPPVALKAEDAEDLEVISALVQDAVISDRDVVFLKETGVLFMGISRYLWENELSEVDVANQSNSEEQPCAHMRRHALLRFEGVDNVQRNNFETAFQDHIGEILAINWDEKENIEIQLAGGGSLAFATPSLNCYLQDVGEEWPTQWRPSH